MGSTNILIFNPTQANQETDAEYLADATRLGGALNGDAWQDVSANKTLDQASIMVAALAQMMANKGFTISDASYAPLVAQLANILTSVDLRMGLQNLAWSSTITLTVNKFLGFAIALTANATLAVTGPTAGDMVVLLYTQGSAGGSVVTFPSNFYGASQPDPTPNVTSGQIFMVDAALNFWAVGALISPTGINNTPIGVAAPASGNFSTLKVASAAPSGQVLTGNGTSYVPETNPGWSSGGSSGSGYWVKDPVGHIRQWGQNFAAPGTLTFPKPFTNAASISVQAVEVRTSSGETTRTVFINDDSADNSFSTTSVYINVSNDADIQVCWVAEGY